MLYRSRSSLFFLALFLIYSSTSKATIRQPWVYFSEISTLDTGPNVLQFDQKPWSMFLGDTNINPFTDKKTVQKGEIFVPRGLKGEKAEFVWKLIVLIKKIEKENGQPIDVPYELIFAQAILESGWGTSIAAKNDLNLFGIRNPDGSSKMFSSYLKGMKTYLHALENHPAHEAFRGKLRETNNPLVLTKYLASYCNCGGYPNKLNKIIEQNNLTQING